MGVLALLGVVDAAPKKNPKRRGTFAAYIDPAAPDDPPRPAAPKPTPLSVVLLIDRSPFHPGGLLDESAIMSVAYELVEAVLDDDLVGVMACDATVELVMKPVWGADAWRVTRAAYRLKAGAGGTLTAGLEEARTYLGPAPGRKVIVFVTDGGRTDANLHTTLDAIRGDGITLVVVPALTADERDLEHIAQTAGGRVVAVHGNSAVPTPFTRYIRGLHFPSAR